jgi:hypothetical protein
MCVDVRFGCIRLGNVGCGAVMSDAFERVIALLPVLTTEQLQEVSVRITFLVQPGKPTTKRTKENVYGDLVWSCLSDELKDQGIVVVPRHALARHDKSMRSFDERAAAFPVWVKMHLAEVHSAELRSVTMMAVRALIMYMKRAGAPIGTLTVARNIHKLSDALVWQFPGYAESGLLRMMLNTRRKNVRTKSGGKGRT